MGMKQVAIFYLHAPDAHTPLEVSRSRALA